jgi:exonuclease SbcD
MRAVVCGDVHIGAVFGLGGPTKSGGNSRVDDYAATLNWIVDYAINTKADLFIQTGDLFESRNPSLEYMSIADSAIKRLSSNNIPTFIIMGNHDYKKTGSSYTSSILSLSSNDSANVKILIDPKMIHFTSQKNESANLLLIPYRDRRNFPGKNNSEQSESVDKMIRSMISSVNNKDPIIAVGHNFFLEGSYNEYGGSEVMINPSAFAGCDVSMMGHLHQYRVVNNTSVPCIYTGSMERTNFGDMNVKKIIVDYDFSLKRAKFIETPVRELLDKSIDLSSCDISNISYILDQEISALNPDGKIVRIKITCDERFFPLLDRSVIQNKLYAGKAHFVSKIMIEASTKRTVRDSSILNYSDDLSMIKAFIESQDLDKTFKDELILEAKSIVSGAK